MSALSAMSTVMCAPSSRLHVTVCGPGRTFSVSLLFVPTGSSSTVHAHATSAWRLSWPHTRFGRGRGGTGRRQRPRGSGGGGGVVALSSAAGHGRVSGSPVVRAPLHATFRGIGWSDQHVGAPGIGPVRMSVVRLGGGTSRGGGLGGGAGVGSMVTVRIGGSLGAPQPKVARAPTATMQVLFQVVVRVCFTQRHRREALEGCAVGTISSRAGGTGRHGAERGGCLTRWVRRGTVGA